MSWKRMQASLEKVSGSATDLDSFGSMSSTRSSVHNEARNMLANVPDAAKHVPSEPGYPIIDQMKENPDESCWCIISWTPPELGCTVEDHPPKSQDDDQKELDCSATHYELEYEVQVIEVNQENNDKIPTEVVYQGRETRCKVDSLKCMTEYLIRVRCTNDGVYYGPYSTVLPLTAAYANYEFEARPRPDYTSSTSSEDEDMRIRRLSLSLSLRKASVDLSKHKPEEVLALRCCKAVRRFSPVVAKEEPKTEAEEEGQGDRDSPIIPTETEVEDVSPDSPRMKKLLDTKGDESSEQPLEERPEPPSVSSCGPVKSETPSVASVPSVESSLPGSYISSEGSQTMGSWRADSSQLSSTDSSQLSTEYLTQPPSTTTESLKAQSAPEIIVRMPTMPTVIEGSTEGESDGSSKPIESPPSTTMPEQVDPEPVEPTTPKPEPGLP